MAFVKAATEGIGFIENADFIVVFRLHKSLNCGSKQSMKQNPPKAYFLLFATICKSVAFWGRFESLIYEKFLKTYEKFLKTFFFLDKTFETGTKQLAANGSYKGQAKNCAPYTKNSSYLWSKTPLLYLFYFLIIKLCNATQIV